MACDIFIVVVSTIAFKSYFKATNRVLTDKRIILDENVFEVLVLLKDWYDTENRFQDKSWMHSLDQEEAIIASSSNPGEGMLEP
jgi:hAT family C-terminal dimerisation region